MGCGVWGGRGNLRENREDPAPTVGIAVALRAKYRPFLPRRHAHTMHHACRPPMGTYGFYNDVARRVATIFERWNCLIEISLPARRSPKKRLNLSVPFAAVSLLEYGGLNPILPILGGRSDAARCVVIRLHGSHLWGPYGFPNDAARRVATIFERWNCLIETYLPVRRENPPPKKRLNRFGPFAAVSLLEYGGLKHILPFLGGRSDAARRVVIWPSRLPPMGILRFLQRRGATRRYPPIRRSR